MKRCNRCYRELPLDAFGANKCRRDGLQKYCRSCGRAKDRKHYASSSSRRGKVREAQKRGRIANRARLWAYLAVHPCVDCPESDPILLEFDHVRGRKLGDVSTLINQASWKTVLKEIRKCEVRCANCHRRRTAKQRKYFSDFVCQRGSVATARAS